MASYTVRDLLERARAFHHEMAAYYRRLDDRAAQERVHMVLTYLQRHEQNLETCLSAYEKDASQRVLNTWFKFAPGLEMPDCAQFAVVDPNLSVDDVVTLAMRYDECLIRLYRVVEENAVSQDVQNLFRKLLTMAQVEEHHLARDTIEMQDL